MGVCILSPFSKWVAPAAQVDHPLVGFEIQVNPVVRICVVWCLSLASLETGSGRDKYVDSFGAADFLNFWCVLVPMQNKMALTTESGFYMITVEP